MKKILSIVLCVLLIGCAQKKQDENTITLWHWMTDRQKAFEVGCDDYDTKPVDFARLSGKMEILLAEKGCHEMRA